MKATVCILLALFLIGCQGESDSDAGNERIAPAVEHVEKTEKGEKTEKTEKTIHVFVALCENKSQGIVPVSEVLGNGDDPKNNLYWGAMYGTRTFLKKSEAWEVVTTAKDLNASVLERIVLKHRSTGAYLVADAYRGTRIKEAVETFLDSAAGNSPVVLKVGQVALGLYGKAELVAYVGHNGLMDFKVSCPKRQDSSGQGRAAIVLACRSKPYFLPLLTELGCRPVLLTTGLMAPEAYTLEAALEAWLSGQDASGLRDSAARAYHKYQKCGIKGATRLFYAEGWN